MDNDRITHRIRIHARIINNAFQFYHFANRVSKGVGSPAQLKFKLSTPLCESKQIELFERGLRHKLQAQEVKFINSGENQFLTVSHRPQPVALFDLHETVKDLSPSHILLGVSTQHKPVMLNLGATDFWHGLILSDEQGGKTSLLRTLAISSRLVSSPSKIQLCIIAPRGITNSKTRGSLTPLRYLPGLANNIFYELDKIVSYLETLIQQIGNHHLGERLHSRTLVLVDDLDYLMQTGGRRIKDMLNRLLTYGYKKGLHLIATARNDALLKGLAMSYFSTHFYGRICSKNINSDKAYFVPRESTRLLGLGDYLVMHGSNLIRFQGAFLDNYDLHYYLHRLFERHSLLPA